MQRPGRHRRRVAALVLFAVAAISASAVTAASASAPPPELTPQAGSWPATNGDTANTRATTTSAIRSTNVATLHPVWQFKIPGKPGGFGLITTAPVVYKGVLYFQDMNSNVYALAEQTGKMIWKHTFDNPSVGPNGIQIGYGRIYGATEKAAFALNMKNGALLWKRTLVTKVHEGIDMAPQVYDGKMIISSVPGSSYTDLYHKNAVGVVYSLDAATGKVVWSFDTIVKPKSGAYGGGGIWQPPAIAKDGTVFLSTGNAGLWPNRPGDPNAKSRVGSNLYANSVVALNGATGKLKWFHQLIAHDVRDYDIQLNLLSTEPSGKQVFIAMGKNGRAYGWDASTGKALWQIAVGKHTNDVGPLPKKPVKVCPGFAGGMLTPPAVSAGTVFIPFSDNLCSVASATSEVTPPTSVLHGTGGLMAVDAATGRVEWTKKFNDPDFGSATVSNDVVFTANWNGVLMAFSTKTGKRLWTAQAPAAINSPPAVTKNMLIVGAGTGGIGIPKKPVYSITAYAIK
jgi:outer membrane protein assembly factor BamB